ncbi:MAG: hypothetical protein A2W90_23360 [Bacteroidetes bacterium GWF2_42_66]|nr:MAG: hypothetical protein A2W92_03170 [Bacteroidetes bacterium GWA2_42_15]OFY00362.1 MAG: hypothetical protein A2W89_14305 [Bacteroidetes bacterium GWE2_42_39]OFY47068.1 MAG: hypothetical protein A2W90_23360 [Bacteroidetes bacterium GWF2_42_66]HBL76765.1 hypothetical protein [Prolixibacteraceae bacterium]HCU62854.1 hypothetical protein [Prolixibacteraceae bacterium]
MKKILIILLFFAGLVGCENQEIEFPDFDYTGGYFPYQYPVRTLVLGDYIYDNTNDNNHKFLISAAMGGIYDNEKDRVFDIALAPELCSNVKFGSTNEAIHLMPQSYYTLSSSSKLTIPAGKVNGNVEVQLTDAFFNDPLAVKLGYVIPIRLVGSADVDTILQGKAAVANPDPRVAGDWKVAPKNFTMFAVKYVNPFHGTYLRRGSNVLKDPTGNIIENNVYRTPYIVDNETWKLVTTGMEEVSVNSKLNSTKLPGDLMMNLSFGSDGTCTVVQQGSGAPIGTGKFVKGGDEWGGKKRDAIILSYNYTKEYIAPPPPGPVIVNDRDPSITFGGGTWTRMSQDLNYNNDITYTAAQGLYFTFDFTGDGIALYWKTNTTYGGFDVYIDDVFMSSVSLKVPFGYQKKMYETTSLSYGKHTLRVVTNTTGNTMFDYLVYYRNNHPAGLPSGTYTYEAKDTLVVRDRGVTMEVYNPVISN